VVLVGHSCGGAVITAAAAGDPKVKALVYVAAVVPDEGETVGEIFGCVAPHPKAPKLQPDENGLLWVTVDAFRNAIAPDASPEETTLMAATQKPIALRCLGEPMTKVASNAERMRSTIVSFPVDHSPLASQPNSVIELISEVAANI
jgi:pimeloyl-ACP methyl ester carboxylesterase